MCKQCKHVALFKDAKTQAGGGGGGQGEGGGGGDAESEPGEVGERCCQAIKDKSC